MKNIIKRANNLKPARSDPLIPFDPRFSPTERTISLSARPNSQIPFFFTHGSSSNRSPLSFERKPHEPLAIPSSPFQPHAKAHLSRSFEPQPQATSLSRFFFLLSPNRTRTPPTSLVQAAKPHASNVMAMYTY